MPALNIEFTEEELAGVRDLAAAEGKSVKAYVHDAAVREHFRRTFVDGAVKWFNDHKAEFDEAFPDEVPPRDRKPVVPEEQQHDGEDQGKSQAA
ncbi:hypothetical protein NLX86_13220 [Streptomyces sp. A3M-1-3]|uniref:hypothetical protein n=1 Tax=Streptomyces sp. A3M-1-3 TaxID=2962044 RepID=UPI0020B7DB0B|nr:hypothetical protein [Streptomyces sp. A3M-1-3]MCP3819040.1 hypothetical protein [Streptomyces sp. A3M-1-3]